MDKALYIAMTGAKHNMLAQTNHANNMANLNTDGFRTDFAQARGMGVYFGDGHATRAYVRPESPATDFTPGPVKETGRDLDVAIQGDGFIAVQAPDGAEAYTRVGSLSVDPNGMLRNSQGFPVRGNDGPIALPALQAIEIGIDGTLSIVAQGEGPEAMMEIDRIKLVNPELQNMTKGEDGLFRQIVGGDALPDAAVTVVSGEQEGSNVHGVKEFTKDHNMSIQ